MFIKFNALFREYLREEPTVIYSHQLSLKKDISSALPLNIPETLNNEGNNNEKMLDIVKMSLYLIMIS